MKKKKTESYCYQKYKSPSNNSCVIKEKNIVGKNLLEGTYFDGNGIPKTIGITKAEYLEYKKLQQENQQLKIQISAREENYKKLEEALNTKYYCKYTNKYNEWMDCSREEYADMVQANVRLANNWNELKTWLEKELGHRINPNKDKWLTGVYDAYRETIDKMQELERSDSK